MLNYQSPINPSLLFSKKARKCSLGDSISQHIMIMVCTPLGKMPSNPDFGCELWDLQFELIPSVYQWENRVSDSLQNTIMKYEKRLIDVDVRIRLAEVEVDFAFRKYPDVKKKARIVINAKMEETKEHFGFETELYVSPISN